MLLVLRASSGLFLARGVIYESGFRPGLGREHVRVTVQNQKFQFALLFAAFSLLYAVCGLLRGTERPCGSRSGILRKRVSAAVHIRLQESPLRDACGLSIRAGGKNSAGTDLQTGGGQFPGADGGPRRR